MTDLPADDFYPVDDMELVTHGWVNGYDLGTYHAEGGN